VLQCVAACCSEYLQNILSSYKAQSGSAGPASNIYGVLQCVAVCCSVLQCMAVGCTVLRCVAVCCGLLQYAALLAPPLISTACCSVVQCGTVYISGTLYFVAVCCSVLRCFPVLCSVLQCVAVCGTAGPASYIHSTLRMCVEGGQLTNIPDIDGTVRVCV